MEYNKVEFDEPKRGEIYFIATDNNSESVGSEQCNHDRPGIIVSNNVGNKHSGIVEVVYLTTSPKKNLPTHVDIYTTKRPSTALCEQICTVSKHRLRKYINQCSSREMGDIDCALAISLGFEQDSYGKFYEKFDKLFDSMLKPPVAEGKAEEPVVEVKEADTKKSKDKDKDAEVLVLKAELNNYKKMYKDIYDLFRLTIGGRNDG